MALHGLVADFAQLQRETGISGDSIGTLDALTEDALRGVAWRLYAMLQRCAEAPTPPAQQEDSLGGHSVLVPSLVSNIPNIGFVIDDEFDSSSSGEDHAANPGNARSTPSREFRLSRSASSRISVDGYEYINDYMIVDQIGKGQFGRVVLAVREGDTDPVAIKIIPRAVLKKCGGVQPLDGERALDGERSIEEVRNPDLDTLQHEVAVMKKLRHRNIVQLFECIDDAQEGNLYLVMQYVDEGPILTLDEDGRCAILPLATVRDYVRQIVAGLSCLHQCGVLHLDIKPDNLLLSKDGTVYIADFGMSEVIEHTPENLGMLTSPNSASISKLGAGPHRRSLAPSAPTQRGTPAFMSPEMCQGSEISGATDVWSLGVTVYCMLHGELPFRGRSWSETTQRILSATPPIREDLEPAWRDLLTQMLQKDPEDRITLVQLRRHPMLQGSRKQVLSGRSSLASSQVLELPMSPRGPLVVSEAELAMAITVVHGRRPEEEPRVLNNRATLLDDSSRNHSLGSDSGGRRFLPGKHASYVPVPHGVQLLQPRPPARPQNSALIQSPR